MTPDRFPHSIQAEESLIGAYMLRPREVNDLVAEAITPADLYHPGYRRVMGVIQELLDEYPEEDPGTGILVQVIDRMEATGDLDGIGGPEDGAKLLVELQGTAPSTSGSSGYARIIANHAHNRRLIEVGRELAHLASTHPDAATNAGLALELLRPVVDATSHRLKMWKIEELTDEHLTLIEQRQEGHVEGLATGYHDLDAILGGMRAGELIVVGARPSMGKSMLATNIAEHVGSTGASVLFVSLEMSKTQLLDRMYSKASPVALTRILNGDLTLDDWQRISRGSTVLGRYGIHLVVNPSITMPEIQAMARRVQPRCDLVVIDYLGLVQARKSATTRNDAVGEMTRQAKIMAMQLECPVLLLAQLSRKVEDRADKRPTMADLRDSGEIEQHADDVLLLLREEVYFPGQKPGIVEVIVEKNRNGSAHVSVDLAFMGHKAHIGNMARVGTPAPPGPPPPPLPFSGNDDRRYPT